MRKFQSRGPQPSDQGPLPDRDLFGTERVSSRLTRAEQKLHEQWASAHAQLDLCEQWDGFLLPSAWLPSRKGWGPLF